MQEILQEILLLISKDRLVSNNILRVQRSIVIKSKDYLQNLLNKI